MNNSTLRNINNKMAGKFNAKHKVVESKPSMPTFSKIVKPIEKKVIKKETPKAVESKIEEPKTIEVPVEEVEIVEDEKSSSVIVITEKPEA